jgi:hypothetical protein
MRKEKVAIINNFCYKKIKMMVTNKKHIRMSGCCKVSPVPTFVLDFVSLSGTESQKKFSKLSFTASQGSPAGAGNQGCDSQGLSSCGGTAITIDRKVANKRSYNQLCEAGAHSGTSGFQFGV